MKQSEKEQAIWAALAGTKRRRRKRRPTRRRRQRQRSNIPLDESADFYI